MKILLDDLTSPESIALVQFHLAGMQANTPPEHVHALPVDKLRDPSISLYTAWIDGQIAGCGALKALSATEGELKTMRVLPDFLGKGIGRAFLQHLMAEATARGYSTLYLETGSSASFMPAQTLYRQAGFVECGPFAHYKADAHSLFMKRQLT